MTENKYQNGKIYKVIDSAYTSCYYGSTVEQISKRMAKHRRDYNLHKAGKKPMVTIYRLFDEFDVINCKIELVELCPCNTVEELRSREGFYIKNNNCVNRKIEGRTLKEWQNDNRDILQQKRQEYYKDNKEEVLARNRVYRDNNIDKVNEQRKTYREENKEVRNQTFTCDICSGVISRPHRARHIKSLIHQTALQNNI